jgi:hypothetical protein
MALTNQQMLDKVDAAIAKLLDGGAQAYTEEDRSFQGLSLGQLYAMKKELTLAVQREGGNSFFAAQFRDAE